MNITPITNTIFRFTERSFVDLGIQISENFLIDHLSCGAFHPVIGEIIPAVPAPLDPELLRNIPLWKLARNLAMAGTVMEPLLREFGGSLMLNAGFIRGAVQGLTRETGHMAGLSMDIAVDGFADDMKYVAGDILRLAGAGLSSANMIVGSSSFMHLNIDPIKLLSGRTDVPVFRTADIMEGSVRIGLDGITLGGGLNLGGISVGGSINIR